MPMGIELPRLLSKRTDEASSRDLIRGEPDACRTVVELHYAKVYQTLRYLSGNSDVAADLTQETFVQAWQSLHTVRNHDTIGAWLKTIAARVWWKYHKAQHQHAHLDDFAETLPSEADSHDKIVLDGIEWQTVACAIAKLPADYRTLVVLHHLQQLTQREIADSLSLPVGTVKSRLFEAMRRLRRTLSHLSEEK